MDTRQLNLLNIGLMIFSTVVAFILPFELFLFSYAVLGPLHYLTEISWLHKRNYFIKGKYDFLWLVLLGLFGTFGYFGIKGFTKWSDIAPYVALLSAVGFYLIKDGYLRILAVFMIIISAGFLNDNHFYIVFFLIFLPTIFHVFFFTGSFILHGAIKSKSATGKWSLVIFIACAFSFFFIVPDFSHYQVTDYIKKSYNDFAALNFYIINFLQLDQLAKFDQQAASTIFSSDTGYKVMRFIAFAYTYHYLNWFSKTSIIKWHQVERKYLILTLSIWVLALVVYSINYQTGLKFLFFLSFLHVFLEFPLNCKTFIDLGKEIRIPRFSRG